VLVQLVTAVMVSVADEKLLVISEFLTLFCCWNTEYGVVRTGQQRCGQHRTAVVRSVWRRIYLF